MTGSRAYPRPVNDYYKTPDWVPERFLSEWGPIITPPQTIRALLSSLRRMWPEATIEARDVCPQPGDEGVVVPADFWLDDRPESYDLVITNPPYEVAEAFVRNAMGKVRQGGHNVQLLRLDFLGSKERKPLWREFGYPEWVYVHAERPSFRGEGTDTTYSAWFVWACDGVKRREAKVRVI